MALIGSITPELAERDAAAYVEFLDGQPETDTSRPIGVQGYCMGGALAFRTAAASARVGAVASFHGGGLVTDHPASPHRLVGRAEAAFLVAIADSDHQADPAARDTVAAALAAAGRPATVEVYAGAGHGWTVPDSPVYDEPSAERAWSALLDLYGRALATG
jgi:carboxymethylenebutenolidase